MEDEEPIVITIGVKTFIVIIVAAVAVLGGLAVWYWFQGQVVLPAERAPAELERVRSLTIAYISEHYPEIGQDLRNVKFWNGERIKIADGRNAYKFTGDSWQITIQWARHKEVKAEITYVVSVVKLVGYDNLRWRGTVTGEKVGEISHHF